MGEVEITSEIGNGEYYARPVYNTENAEEQIRLLELQIDQLDALIATAETDVADAQTAVDDAAAVQAAALAAYKAAPNPTTLAAVSAATADLQTKVGERDAAQSRLDQLGAKKQSALSWIDKFNKRVSPKQIRKIWCADYTEGLSGALRSIEIDGKSDNMLIYPGARLPGNLGGQLLESDFISWENIFINYVFEAAWQKFYPTYRVGAIKEIDYDTDRADVDLDPAATERGVHTIDVNQTNKLLDVPIDYMECDSGAFVVGDRVVIEFIGQNWEEPILKGFESHPNTCYFLYSSYSHSANYKAQVRKGFTNNLKEELAIPDGKTFFTSVDSAGNIVGVYEGDSYPAGSSWPSMKRFDGFSLSELKSVDFDKYPPWVGVTWYNKQYYFATECEGGFIDTFTEQIFMGPAPGHYERVSHTNKRDCNGTILDTIAYGPTTDLVPQISLPFWYEGNLYGFQDAEIRKYAGFSDTVVAALPAPALLNGLNMDNKGNLIICETYGVVTLMNGFSLTPLQSFTLSSGGSSGGSKAFWGIYKT